MTKKSDDSLAAKYRPKKFGEIVGQQNAVEFLTGLVRHGRMTRHILLCGSVGSGKTTLARIYAKALNCEALEDDCSPCLRCAACQAVEYQEPHLFSEIDAPRYRDAVSFRDTLDALQRMPFQRGERRVVFVDEAHSLRRLPGVYAYLLKTLEEAPKGLSFVFATTEPDELSDALRSRLTELTVRALSLDEGCRLLRSIAEREGIARVEDEGMMLLWRMGDGQPRNMVQALDQLHVRDKGITRDQVRDVFDVKDIDALLAYFVSLGEGQFVKQAQAFSSWHANIRLKVSRIQSLLVHMYYNDLIGHPLFVDAVVSSIRAEERAPILKEFRRRLSDEEALRRAWQEMLVLLPVYPNELADDGLLAQVILFQERVCASDLGRTSSIHVNEMPDIKTDKVPARKAALARPPQNPRFLSVDLVKNIYNSASAFTQAFGRQFNVKITIYHEAFGCQDQKAAGKNAGAFTHALTARLKDWYGHGDRLLVQEVDPKLGPCGRVIASLPDIAGETITRLERWTRRWKENLRTDPKRSFGIEIEPCSDSQRMGAHWECVRWLCAGLDPADPTYQRLNLPWRSPGDIGNGNRYASSDSCGPDLSKVANSQGFPFLSAFDDLAWSELYEGWELEIYDARSKLLPLDEGAAAAGINEFRSFCEKMKEQRKLQFWKP